MDQCTTMHGAVHFTVQQGHSCGSLLVVRLAHYRLNSVSTSLSVLLPAAHGQAYCCLHYPQGKQQ
jgi:hypothetical protein